MNIVEFRKKYPTDTLTLSSGKSFSYRYYKNSQAKTTVVLLTGGIGLSDLFYLHFERFTKDFSVITFDYQICSTDNEEFAQAESELLHCLVEKVWLIGQSLGGIVAQIIAVHHAEVVEGMVLSNTCSLSKAMSPSAYKHLMNMINSQKSFKRLLSFLPFPMIKRLIRRAVMNQTTSGFTQKEKELMEELCGVMMKLLTKPYELHMIDFLIDAQNHFGMSRENFFPWENKVLLILSEDDATFTRECKDAVIIGGHDRMVCQYKQICKSFNCKAKVFTQMSATLSKQIGNPDLIVLFTNTVSHKMVRCAVEEAERCNADVVRCHTSSKNALQEILGSVCM